MLRLHRIGSALMIYLVVTSAPAQSQSGDAARGERVFRACAACHSLAPDRNMTGPSLSAIWNRKAGSLASFERYSAPLASSEIIWNDKSLDAWIADPQQFIPGNTMTFRGVKEPRQRADLLAYLKEATQPGRAPATAQGSGRGGMMGMMGGNVVPNLKTLEPDERVVKITHCRDTYRVTTADGKTRAFWERNLRFKTDVGDDGPSKGAPGMVPAGMMGDRADIIFAAPEEISRFIASEC